MSVINTNITSMIGQSNLTKSQNALQTSMERLSSGLRINSAKDDAAGQIDRISKETNFNGVNVGLNSLDVTKLPRTVASMVPLSSTVALITCKQLPQVESWVPCRTVSKTPSLTCGLRGGSGQHDQGADSAERAVTAGLI